MYFNYFPISEKINGYMVEMQTKPIIGRKTAILAMTRHTMNM